MTNAFKSKIAKAGLGLFVGASMLIGAGSALAMTSAQATAFVAALGITGAQATALVSALTDNSGGGATGGSSSNCYQFPTPVVALKMGSNGDAVKQLQILLNSDTDTQVAASGVASKGMETSHFGPAVQAAVKKWQVKHNISPAVGFFGKVSQQTANTQLSAMCTTGSGTGTGTGTGTNTGNGTLSLATDNPASMNIPVGATGVTVLKFNVVGTDTTPVTTVVIKRGGLGNASEFSSVYLYNGDTRLSSGRSISSDTNTVSFSNLGIKTSATLSVKVDVATGNNAVGGFHTFSVASVNGTATTIVGNEMAIVTAATVSTVTVDNTSGNWTDTLGTTGAEVAKFSVSAGSNAAVLTTLTFRQGGTLSSGNLKNLKLVTGSTTVATADMMTGDKAIFSFATPYTIAKGQIKNFTMTADLTGGRSGDTIQFYVDANSDMYILDGKYNLGAAVTNNFALGDQTVTMQGGQLTLAKAGPSATTYAAGTNGNSLMNINVTSQGNVTVRNAKISIASTGMSSGDLAYVKNIKLIDLDSSSTLMGSYDDMTKLNGGGTCAINSTCYIVSSDSFDLSAGTTRHFAIQADFDTNLSSGVKLTATLDLGGTNYVYDNDAGQYVLSSVIVPASVTNVAMTVTTSSATVAKLGTPSSTSVVKGATDVSALGVNISAGASDSLQLDRLVARIYADTSTSGFASAGSLAANTIVSSVDLFDGTSTTPLKTSNLTLVGTIGSGGYYKADFNTLALAIAKGTQKNLYVKLNLMNTFTGTKYVAVDLVPSTDLEIENSQGNTLTGLSSSHLNLQATPSPEITTKQNGTLTVAVDGTTPNADMAVTGSTGVNVTKYKFTASDDEAFEVKGLTIARGGSSSDSDIGTVHVSYTDPSGAAVTKDGSLANGVITFLDGALDIAVPKGGSSTMTISSDFNTISGGAASGDSIKLCLDKVATDCGNSANLTDTFIAYGSSSGQQILGNTNSVTLVDTAVKAVTIAKTKVVAVNSLASAASTISANTVMGKYTFTSTSQGNSQNSTLTSITVAPTGSLIVGGGDGNVNVNFYKNSIDANNLLNSTPLVCTAAAGTMTCAAKTLNQNNEFSGSIDVLAVVDTTDSDFVDTTGTQGLATSLTAYAWNDGVGSVSPVAGLPVTGGTLTY